MKILRVYLREFNQLPTYGKGRGCVCASWQHRASRGPIRAVSRGLSARSRVYIYIYIYIYAIRGRLTSGTALRRGVGGRAGYFVMVFCVCAAACQENACALRVWEALSCQIHIFPMKNQAIDCEQASRHATQCKRPRMQASDRESAQATNRSYISSFF